MRQYLQPLASRPVPGGRSAEPSSQPWRPRANETELIVAKRVHVRRPRRAPGQRAAIRKRDYEALAEFRFALRRLLAFSEAAARDAGLMPQQHQALLAIKGFPGRDHVSVNELAGRLMIRHHSAVELVDRLSLGGFILRHEDGNDRRRGLISVTAKAERLLDRLSAAHLEELGGSGPALPALLDRFGRR